MIKIWKRDMQLEDPHSPWGHKESDTTNTYYKRPSSLPVHLFLFLPHLQKSHKSGLSRKAGSEKLSLFIDILGQIFKFNYIWSPCLKPYYSYFSKSDLN